MFRTLFVSIGLSVALAAAPGSTADAKISKTRLDQIMSAWPAEVRDNAQRLVAAYGLPDRVTSTILVWDVPSEAQQQAMMRTAGNRAPTAEAGGEMISVKQN